MSATGSDRVTFGPFEADLHTHELWKYGTKIKLVGQPFEILAILLKDQGKLVTREELRAALWPADTFVDFNHGLNAAVNKLRESLCDSAEKPCYVETLPRRGYRFIAAVARKTSGPPILTAPVPAPRPAPAEPPPVPVPTFEPYQSAEPVAFVPKPRWLTPYFVGAGLLLPLILTGAFLFENSPSNAHGAELLAKISRGRLGSSNFPAQRIKPLTSPDDETSEPAFSPDGNYVAFRRESTRPDQSGIFVKAVAGDELVQLTRDGDDCCPVWSPDGSSIAFSRHAKNKEFSIYTVPFTRSGQRQADGLQSVALRSAAAERRVQTGEVVPKRGELDWSPDGKTIAFAADSGIHLLSLDTLKPHRLTQPPPSSEDWGPAFSPDGARLLFVRSPESGFPNQIMAVSVSGGEPIEITTDNRILGPPQWSYDGRSVIFASDRGSHPALWRVSAEAKDDSAVEINDSGWYPSVSHRGFRLAYQRITRSLSIWQIDFSGPGKEKLHVLLPSTSETDQGPGPQFSPDGKKLAYMSDRSGTMEIWVSDHDGSNSYQLTAVGNAGTPRWSPDSQSITFDAGRENKGTTIYTVNVKGGAAHPLIAGGSEDVCPSWSQDGKWIYFASHRSGDWQVWKVSSEGGSPVQVTIHGGHAPLMSLDGKYVFYAKTEFANPEIWQIPTEGGVERLVSPLVRPATWASWSVVQRGILFAGPSGSGSPTVSFFDFSQHRVNTVAALNIVPFWFASTRDGNTVVFDQPGMQQAQIMLVENFR